jgi:Vta1 C-terminal domain
LDTDGGHISAPADALPPGDAAQQPGVQAPLAPAPQQWQQQQQGAPYSSSSISPYPSARPPPPPSPRQQQQQKPPAPVAAPAAPLMPAPVPGFTPSSTAISDAQKAAKYAASSLAFDDVAGGIKYLTDALRLLTQPAQPRR